MVLFANSTSAAAAASEKALANTPPPVVEEFPVMVLFVNSIELYQIVNTPPP
jgi:hypothetical protein